MAVLRPAAFSLLVGLFLSGEAAAPPPSDGEVRMKAAYLFHFVMFVEWPASAFHDNRTPLVFAVLGEDPFGSILDETLGGKTIGGRGLEVRRFPTLAELGACHVLFVGRSEKDRLTPLREALRGRPVLTASDLEEFARSGTGIFRFFLEEKKLRFEINVDAAQRAGLKVSAKLLKVGAIVHDPPAAETPPAQAPPPKTPAPKPSASQPPAPQESRP